MADEHDGINEALAGALRVSLTVAAQFAERAARQREQVHRDAQAASEQQARELRERLGSERAAARAALAPVGREEWWQHAQPDDIARAWETAQAWRDVDRDARLAAEHISDELQRRYAIDTNDLRADPGAVRDAIARRDAASQGAGAERARARGEEAQTLVLLADAARDDTERAPADAAEDEDRGDANARLADVPSREVLAGQLEGVVDADTVEARVVAATNQARPAEEAVQSAPRRGPRARPARGSAGRAKDRSRSR